MATDNMKDQYGKDYLYTPEYFERMKELGYSREQAESIKSIVWQCFLKDGAATGAATGLVGAVAGGTVSFGTLAAPSWLAGFLVGSVVGTGACAYTPAKILADQGVEAVKSQINRFAKHFESAAE